jgi:two-component system, chemotaxis family, chemotaxis protein CheY
MGYYILIVDDSSIIRAAVKKAIEMSGLDVAAFHEAANGKQALETLDQQWVDIVLTDINMPEMSGVELIERMAADDLLSKIPAVIVSTERSRTRIEKLMAMGVRAYIKKPFRPEDFRDVIGAILAGS